MAVVTDSTYVIPKLDALTEELRDYVNNPPVKPDFFLERLVRSPFEFFISAPTTNASVYPGFHCFNDWLVSTLGIEDLFPRALGDKCISEDLLKTRIRKAGVDAEALPEDFLKYMTLSLDVLTRKAWEEGPSRPSVRFAIHMLYGNEENMKIMLEAQNKLGHNMLLNRSRVQIQIENHVLSEASKVNQLEGLSDLLKKVVVEDKLPILQRAGSESM
jgi:hypothetical protein